MEAIVLSLLLLILHIPLMNGEIQSIEIFSDSRNLIMLDDFGFSNDGHISILLSSVSISSKSANSSLMGFFYSPSPAFDALRDGLFNDSCIMGKPSIFPIFIFSNSSLESINRTISITSPDLYYVFFLNCAPETSISMQVKLETYNLIPGGHKDFIDEHFIVPSTIGCCLLTIYFIFLMVWLHACYKNKQFVRKIHIFMLVLLLVKSLELLSREETQRFVRSTGTPNGQDIIWLVLYFIRTLLFIIVFMLMGNGWSLLTPCLPYTKKLALASSVFLQMVVNLCFIIIRGMGPFIENYTYWVVAFYSLDLLSSMSIVFPVANTIDNLREIPQTEGKGARISDHLRLFVSLYACLQAYVYFEKLGIFVVGTFLSYNFLWVNVLLEQSIEACVLMVAFYMFWPDEKNEHGLADRNGEELGLLSSVPPIV